MQTQQSDGAALQRDLNDLCNPVQETVSTVVLYVGDESSDESPGPCQPYQG